MFSKTSLRWAAWASAAFLAGCASTGGDAPAFKPLSLQIAHINDHHSQLEPQSAEFTLGGQATRVSLGGFARVTAAMKQLQSQNPHLLKLHAGDAITGTLYYTFFKGEADARLMNTVCFDAFALGNHEFDDGDDTLSGFLKALRSDTCQTPVLAANVKPQAGTPLNPASGALIQPYTIKTVDGVPVGIVGIDIAGKTMNSSRPLASTRFSGEVEAAQDAIRELRRQGVRHVVLLTHQGYDKDKALAAQLTDVDVIIGGDSHSLLGDFKHLGVASSGAYPTSVKNKDGDLVCVGQAWEYTKALGVMNVQFDGAGRVSACTGQASLLMGEPFERKGADGKWAPMPPDAHTALIADLARDPAVRLLAPYPSASQVLSQYTTQVNAQKNRPVGQIGSPLCLVRVPGESTNRSATVAGCETANTLAQGSSAAQIVAQAFLAASKRGQIALQNAGGVRTGLPAGELTMNQAISVLPFTNTLVEMDLSGQEIVQALEDAVSNHLDKKQSDGAHPYAAGLRWNLDLSQAKGQRFSQLQVQDRRTGQWSALDLKKRYVVVTNDFIASGKDGYTALGEAWKAQRVVNTYVLYTQSFIDYLQHHKVQAPARADYSHQTVINAQGQRLP